MSIHRRRDTVAETVLAGDAAGLRALGLPDLAAVADTLAPLRRTAQDGPVQPTPALAALLEHGTGGLVHAPGAAPHTPHPGAGTSGRFGRHVTAPTTRRKHMLTEWLGGLGLAAKLSVASAVAAASVGVTGAAGALPAPVQHGFDQTVSAVTPFGDDDPAGPSTGITVETDEPSDGATTDPSDDATPGGTDDPTPGTTDDPSSTSAEPSDDASASPDDEATHDDDEDEDHHSSASDDDGDEDHATSGRHRRNRGSGSGSTTSGSRSHDDDVDEDRSGSSRDEADDRDDEDHSGHGSGGSDDGEDDDRSGSGSGSGGSGSGGSGSGGSGKDD